jgi:histidinol-phosphate/aromatic aminotransferase/cobyric acid decarboxylase-like protein
MVANPALAGRIRSALPKWNLNSFAEIVVFMMKQFMPEYRESLRKLGNDRRAMFQQLSAMPELTVYPSQGNFLLVKLPPGHDGVPLKEHLLTQHDVYVRECGNKLGTTSQFLRLVVRPQEDVRRLLVGMTQFLYSGGSLSDMPVIGLHHRRTSLSA